MKSRRLSFFLTLAASARSSILDSRRRIDGVSFASAFCHPPPTATTRRTRLRPERRHRRAAGDDDASERTSRTLLLPPWRRYYRRRRASDAAISPLALASLLAVAERVVSPAVPLPVAGIVMHISPTAPVRFLAVVRRAGGSLVTPLLTAFGRCDLTAVRVSELLAPTRTSLVGPIR